MLNIYESCFRYITIVLNLNILVGPNNLWARPTSLGGVQRPKPKKVMALAQKYKTKKWPGGAAVDSLVLGRPKAPLRRGVKKKRYRNKFVRRSKISWESYPYYPSQIRLCT